MWHITWSIVETLNTDNCIICDYCTDTDKSKEDRDREEDLLQQVNKLVETRDFLVDDVEFERLR